MFIYIDHKFCEVNTDLEGEALVCCCIYYQSFSFFLSFSLSLSCFEMGILQVSYFFVAQGFLTPYLSRLLFWHTFLCIHYPHTPNGLLMFVQWLSKCGRGKRECSKVASVPRLGPVRGEKRRLFYFQQPKRKSALLETCLFMEMVEGWERKRSGESSGKIWSPCRGEVWYLFRWGWVKYGL